MFSAGAMLTMIQVSRAVSRILSDLLLHSSAGDVGVEE